jgi:hypothetical protein
MSHVAVILGDFKSKFPMSRRHYFEERWTFLDCRGRLEIAKSSHLGFGVKIITATHHYDAFNDDDNLGKIRKSTVIIEDHAWIGSHVLLYRCKVGHHSIVGAGCVIKAVQVPPWTVIDGHPPMIVGMFDYHRDGRFYPIDPHPLKRF